MQTLDCQALADERKALGFIWPILEEFQRRLDHPYFLYVPDNHPDRNQQSFHESEDGIRLLFGGNQSGKSRAGSQEIAWWLMNDHPFLELHGCLRKSGNHQNADHHRRQRRVPYV